MTKIWGFNCFFKRQADDDLRVFQEFTKVEPHLLSKHCI